jgi:hypothetical protein
LGTPTGERGNFARAAHTHLHARESDTPRSRPAAWRVD